MPSKLYGFAKVRNTKKNAWCLQWNMVVAVSLCGAAWVLLVSGSCISLMASWIHKCTALYWKRRCYRHSVPLVVVHFSNMTMILNTHLRPLLDFWRKSGWKWFSGQVSLCHEGWGRGLKCRGNQVFFNNKTKNNKNHPEGEKNKQAGRRLEHSQTLNTHDVRHTKDNGSAQDCRHKETI